MTSAGQSTAEQAVQPEVQRPSRQDQPPAAGSPVPHAAVSGTTVRHRGDTQQGIHRGLMIILDFLFLLGQKVCIKYRFI